MIAVTNFNFLESIQKIQLAAYTKGRAYQSTKHPITNTFQNRIRLPICEKHDIDPLWQICKKCGMITEELLTNDL